MSRVAVLSGGRSSEHEVSLSSGDGVRGGLREADHDVVDVRIGRDGRWTADGRDVALCPGEGLLGCDVAFPVLHGPFGEDGTLQGLLECLDVPYVGAGVLASALCMDKVLFKDLMARAGLPQVPYVALREEGHGPVPLAEARALGLPVFVKPARLGSSVGIAKVSSADELEDAVRDAFAFDPLVIVEAAAFGGEATEVECSVLGNAEPEASEPGEIVIGADWYDYEAKYTEGGMTLQVPARVSSVARDRVRSLAVESFVRSDCAGLARVDFFVSGDDVLLNELNTMPGQTPTSVYAKLWEASGRSYPEVLDALVGLAVERHGRVRSHSF